MDHTLATGTGQFPQMYKHHALSRNVPPAWTETSFSYSVCRDVNTHNRIERCVMYRSSFRTFPSFLNPRAHSAHNTWATL